MSEAPNNLEYIQALKKHVESSKDRVGIMAEAGITATGFGAGAAGATILGVSQSTFWGIAIGTIAAPTYLIVGSAVACGAAAYGLAKLVRSGEKCDLIKVKNQEEIEKKIVTLMESKGETPTEEKKKTTIKVAKEAAQDLIRKMQILIRKEKLTKEKAQKLLIGIKEGSLNFDFVRKLTDEMILEM